MLVLWLYRMTNIFFYLHPFLHCICWSILCFAIKNNIFLDTTILLTSRLIGESFFSPIEIIFFYILQFYICTNIRVNKNFQTMIVQGSSPGVCSFFILSSKPFQVLWFLGDFILNFVVNLKISCSTTSNLKVYFLYKIKCDRLLIMINNYKHKMYILTG